MTISGRQNNYLDELKSFWYNSCKHSFTVTFYKFRLSLNRKKHTCVNHLLCINVTIYDHSIKRLSFN